MRGLALTWAIYSQDTLRPVEACMLQPIILNLLIGGVVQELSVEKLTHYSHYIWIYGKINLGVATLHI